MTSTARTGTELAMEWVYQTLRADATLTALLGSNSGTIAGPSIFSKQAPEGAVYPAVIIAFYLGMDNVAQGASYWMTDGRYILRVADRVGSSAALDVIMARIHTLLHAQFNVVLTHGYMLASERLQPIADPDLPVAGVATRTLAWLYRIQTQEVAA